LSRGCALAPRRQTASSTLFRASSSDEGQLVAGVGHEVLVGTLFERPVRRSTKNERLRTGPIFSLLLSPKRFVYGTNTHLFIYVSKLDSPYEFWDILRSGHPKTGKHYFLTKLPVEGFLSLYQACE
jgi:hypothetical protein